MPEPEMPRPHWAWRTDPGNNFNSIATLARITAGFGHRLYSVDDSEYVAAPELIARDLTLLLVMAIRRARSASVELDLESLIAEARAEVERWETTRAQHRPPEPR